MYFARNAVVGIFIITIDIVVDSQRVYFRGNSDEEDKKDDIRDHYTFVALIDVVFTDATKRTCTGTIIHDNVVITAAHCFEMELDETVAPELTASFVVIGTKKMFDTGYEQYLPIERVVTHPRFKGWSADLALVYTFAGMMSDKPGRIVLLASEKMTSPVDSNVTVFSWGHCKADDISVTVIPHQRETMKVSLETQFEEKSKRYRKRRRKKIRKPITELPSWRHKKRTHFDGDGPIQDLSRLEVSYGEDERRSHIKHGNASGFNTAEDQNKWNENMEKLHIMTKTIRESKKNNRKPTNKHNSFDSLSYYRNNWRRRMGPKQNKLMVEAFSMLYTQACKKILEKELSETYEIENSNEYICYSSDDHYITQEDAGAPAIRHDQLFAVTVGGVDCEGNHVAVGIKINCFCSWIVENLPGDNSTVQCCKNCCDKNENEVKADLGYRHAFMKASQDEDEIA